MKGVDERAKEWYKTPHGISWKKENQIRYNRQRRIRALVALGGKCSKCGFSDLRALHIDHVHNDGSKERSVRKNIEYGLWKGTVDKTRYQLLCANCNWIKRIEDAEVGNDDYNSYLQEINKTISLNKNGME